MATKLFPYQEEGVERMKQLNGRVLLADEMGTGKSVTSIKYIIDENTYPAVIVSPATLKLNWKREFWIHFGKRTEILSGGKAATLSKSGSPVYIINYDILGKWEKQIAELQPKILVLDECFTGDTLIATPNGDVPIESIVIGDLVNNAGGIGKVEAISIRSVQKLYYLELSNGQRIRCTGNHPFFTNEGWRTASELVEGARLFNDEDVRSLREVILPTIQNTAGRHESCVNGRKTISAAEKLFTLLFVCENQPRDVPGITKKSKGWNSRQPFQKPWWQWEGEQGAAELANVVRGWLDTGMPCANSTGNETADAHTHVLQSGFGESRITHSDRDRWEFTPNASSSDLRLQEESSLGSVRVEHITIVENGGSEIVYNLQVAGHASYYANGVLVHNCHLVKAMTANRTKVAMRLARNIPHVLALSGTPMTNKPTELYPILRMVLGDNGIESRREFCDRYSKLKLTPWGYKYEGARRLPELHKRLKETCMVRRLLRDVIKDLPDKTRTTIPVSLSKSNMREYVQMNADFEEWLHKNHPEKEISSAAVVLTKLGYMKRKVAEWKLPFVFDWIDNFLEDTDGKLIVFGLHHKILNAIMSRYLKGSSRYPSAVKIDGTVSLVERQRAVDLFQTRPEVRLFVGQMRASGTGLTLTASHNVLFAECDFVPAVHSQCEGRSLRIGQKNHVQCTYIIANSTIEESVAEILHRKQQTFDAVVDGGRNVDNFNIIQELLRTMRKQFV